MIVYYLETIQMSASFFFWISVCICILIIKCRCQKILKKWIINENIIALNSWILYSRTELGTFVSRYFCAGTFCKSIGKCRYFLWKYRDQLSCIGASSTYFVQITTVPLYKTWNSISCIILRYCNNLQKTSGWRSDTFIVILWSTAMFRYFYKKYRRKSIVMCVCHDLPISWPIFKKIRWKFYSWMN